MAGLKGINCIFFMICLLSQRVATENENVDLLVGVTRTISSPNYPSNYHNNALYNWYITAPSGYEVLIQFLDFSLESGYDYLRIGTGDYRTSPGSVQLDSLTGNNLPTDIVLDTPTSWIQFTSDGSITYRGFQLQLSLNQSSPGDYTSEFPTSTLQTTTYVEDFTTRQSTTAEPVTGDDQFDCDFDSGICGWTQDVTDSFDWSLLSGSTSSSNTGPSSDHTTGFGKYIYIEATPQAQGDIARLTSPEVVARGMKCLQFYYHMYGSTIDTLNVYVSKVGDPLGIPVFQIVGQQGNSWKLAQVDIMRADTDRFVVTLEGIRGSSFTGDIAIDDIILFLGNCSQGQEPVTSTLLVTDVFFTFSPDGSCEGCCDCGYRGGCYCDSLCQSFGDCCPNYAPLCSEVRLVNGSTHREGRVEVYANGQWGTVCDDYWDVRDAGVVCRSMGFSRAEVAFSNAAFGPGAGPIYLDNLGCSGDESSILNCSHNGLGVHDCSHYEDAGLRCSGTDYATIIQETTDIEDITTGPPTSEPANNVSLTVGETQNISSPNYPSNYPNSASYNWFIKAPPGYDVLIRFLDFITEECCDHLNIGTGDSPNATGSTMLARLSGSASQDIRFEGPTGWMLFTSDYSVTGRGFLLRLSLVNSTEEPVTDGPWTQQPTWWWNMDEPTADDPWTLQPTWWWNTDAEAMIFVADLTGSEIYMADFSSDSLDSLTFSPLPLDSVFQPQAVDYDPDTRMVYWTESSGSIRRGNIDGTSQSVIISGLGNPEGIALSTRRGKVFWTDESHDRIISANLNGSSQQVLIDTDIYRPRGIIVHPEQWVMFWTDWNYPSRIERANLEGRHRYVIVNSSLQWPNGLAFNADGSRIYWCDAGTDMIESVGLWGEDRMVHLSTSSIHPFDLAVVDDSIVWTDWNYDAIGITSNDNSSSYSFYYHNVFQNPHGVHVYKEAATDIPTTPWWWNNPTTWWWGPTNYPPVDENVNLVVGVTRIISSPNYPSNYHDNALYNWYITAPSGYDVLIQFLDFSLESGYDYLRIGTGDSRKSRGSVQLASLTGTDPPSDIVLDTPTSWIQFTSDGSITYRGFQLELSLSQSSPVRLVNGSNPVEGRVEVYANGQWGTVCDDNWDLTDAGVVCRSMGFAGAETALSNAAFGPGTGPIYLDSIHCSGSESSILNCSHNGLGIHDCSHGEDAGVRCTDFYDITTHHQPTTAEPAAEETELTCDNTTMTLILDRNLLEIGDDAGDVHFEDESCVGYEHDNGHVAITTTYDRCGTTLEESDEYTVYTNVVTYYKPRPENDTNGAINREEYLRIPITCILKREQVLVPMTGVVSFSEDEYGDFSLSLDRYTSSGFYEHANDSGEVVLGTPLYYGVRLTAVTNLTLLIDSCWATTSLNPVDDYRHDIIEQGCAVNSTTYIYSGLAPTFKGFRVDAFTFITDYEKVYVHCSIHVCDNEDSGSRCTQGCLSRARRSLQPAGSRSKPHTITNGPLSDASHFQQNNMVDKKDGVENLSPAMIATVTALCVVIALTVIMSMVMMGMRRNRQELIGYRRVGVIEEDF